MAQPARFTTEIAQGNMNAPAAPLNLCSETSYCEFSSASCNAFGSPDFYFEKPALKLLYVSLLMWKFNRNNTPFLWRPFSCKIDTEVFLREKREKPRMLCLYSPTSGCCIPCRPNITATVLQKPSPKKKKQIKQHVKQSPR